MIYFYPVKTAIEKEEESKSFGNLDDLKILSTKLSERLWHKQVLII